MKYVEVVADAGSTDTIAAIAEKHKANDFHKENVDEDGRRSMRLLLTDDQVQPALDTLQHVLGAQLTARIMVIPVDTVLPRPTEEEKKGESSSVAARDAIYDSVEKNARLDVNFIVLVMLSTIVAAIGLIENNVAVVIGAMVIAPLLGPNLAFGLGTALGDVALMRKSAKSISVGILLAILLSVLLGYFWTSPLDSSELMSRTYAGLDSVALALASGAAAALSLTTGLSSVLVGVMVAVALLPPAATIGLMLGQGSFDLALGATLLLAVNIVCVNLASKLVFLIKGISPRTWLEKEAAKRSMRIYVLVWVLSLMILMLFILLRSSVNP